MTKKPFVPTFSPQLFSTFHLVDSPSIKYFSKDDFEKILDRAEFYGLKIFGIEPWPDRQFFNARVYEEYDTSADNPEWYRDAYDRFLEEGVTSYFSATYGVPENLLKKFLLFLSFYLSSTPNHFRAFQMPSLSTSVVI